MTPVLRIHFDQALAQLNEEVLELASRARRAAAAGLQSFLEKDAELASEVIAGDTLINELRYRIEKRCYALLATEQPVASDLRTIVAILSICNELERIGDHGKRIAWLGRRLSPEAPSIPTDGLHQMAQVGLTMLDRAMQAFSRRDPALAREVCAADDHVDALYKQTFNIALSYMLENPHAIGSGTHVIQVGHELERIADRATNIAERVIFIETGELVELNV
ncbi:MAG: phosphate signaling complex protein PhoU [Anaerolineae bacterium]